MLDIIENYKYKDEVVSIVKETKKGKLFKKNETIYNPFGRHIDCES